jgi:hypothetical protein
MIKPKRTAAEQVEDEAARRALNPIGSRQTIAESQAEPKFQENHNRLKADRLAREAKLKGKGKVTQNLLLGVSIGLVGTLVVLTARYIAALLTG